jgi:hypothetical protein
MMSLQAPVRRGEERFTLDEPISIFAASGALSTGRIKDISLSGAAIVADEGRALATKLGEPVRVFIAEVGFSLEGATYVHWRLNVFSGISTTTGPEPFAYSAGSREIGLEVAYCVGAAISNGVLPTISPGEEYPNISAAAWFESIKHLASGSNTMIARCDCWNKILL